MLTQKNGTGDTAPPTTPRCSSVVLQGLEQLITDQPPAPMTDMQVF